MNKKKLIDRQGILCQKVQERTAEAKKSGALQPIPTEFRIIEENNIPFIVRILSNLVRKEEAKKEQEKKSATLGKDFNPFLPYEENLFVTDISDTHVCLLNKFNVVEEHLLIITRAFEEQESLLNLEDFFALWTCMAEFEGLAFYNSGKIAGASQRHKHLQIVPLPLTNTGVNIPLDKLLSEAIFDNRIGIIPDLPYQHGLFKLDPIGDRSPLAAASLILDGYNRLLQTLNLVKNGEDYPQPYNLLATREWMLIVPRSAEFFESIAINSLGFAGALLVKNEEQLQFLQAYGIMNVLKNVAFPVCYSQRLFL